ncbi:hypothetical protein CC2G_009664 [Coprinopsis cinerea AmutBmut pab1-1]|nr:hypothetical protein CC2G_009664 [Coprinopsis cinerea AmutBmut pab1-1]
MAESSSFMQRFVQRTFFPFGGSGSAPPANDAASKTGSEQTSTSSVKGSASSTSSGASIKAHGRRHSMDPKPVSREPLASAGATQLRRVSSVSSLRSAASSSKRKVKNSVQSVGGFWKKVTAVTTSSISFLGGSTVPTEPEASKPTQDGNNAEPAKPQPQLLYYMGSRSTSSLASELSSSASAVLSKPPQAQGQKGGGHAKLLSMVAEGDEDDTPVGSSSYSTNYTGSSSVSGDATDTSITTPTSATTPATPNAPLPKPMTAADLGFTSPPGRTIPLASRYTNPFAHNSTPSGAPPPTPVVHTIAPPNSPELNTVPLPSIHVVAASSDGQPSVPPTNHNQEPAEKEEEEEDLSDPTVLARKIQELIDSLPPPPVWEHPIDPDPNIDVGPPTPAPGTPRRRFPGSPRAGYPYPGSPHRRFPGSPRSRYPGSPRGGGGSWYPGSPRPNPITRMPAPPPPRTPKRDKQTGKPLPPPDAVPEAIKHAKGVDKVLEWLWRAPAMNGGSESGRGKGVGGKPGGGGRERKKRSVWNILESYDTTGHIPPTPYTPGRTIPLPPEDEGSGAPGGTIPLPPVEDEGEGEGEVEDEDHEHEHEEWYEDPNDKEGIFTDGSSIMLYSPILPGQRDLVEMGDLVSVWVEEDLDGDVEEPAQQQHQQQLQPQQQPEVKAWSWMPRPAAGMWQWFGASSSATTSTAASTTSLQVPTSPLPTHNNAYNYAYAAKATYRTYTSPDGRTRHVRILEQKAWAPSNEKMSVQVFWWGYRLYLPPPVLLILSDKTVEATKRAAMITTALTWFFNNIPVASLPIAVQPTVLLLQRLAPYLGYIGTFISWSWQQIKSYDVGNGVIMTATWLLPIALIPGTWWDHSFPKSPAAQAPIPLPPTDETPSQPQPNQPRREVPAPGTGDDDSDGETEAPTESTPSSPGGGPIGQPTVPSAPSTGPSPPSIVPESSTPSEAGESVSVHSASSGAAKPAPRTRKTSLSATFAAFIGRKGLVKSNSTSSTTTSASSSGGGGGTTPTSTTSTAPTSAVPSPTAPMSPAQVRAAAAGASPAHVPQYPTPPASTGTPASPTITSSTITSPTMSMYATPMSSPVPTPHAPLQSFPVALTGGTPNSIVADSKSQL